MRAKGMGGGGRKRGPLGRKWRDGGRVPAAGEGLKTAGLGSRGGWREERKSKSAKSKQEPRECWVPRSRRQPGCRAVGCEKLRAGHASPSTAATAAAAASASATAAASASAASSLSTRSADPHSNDRPRPRDAMASACRQRYCHAT